jgi:Ca2+-binding RTX toxin-like protein
VISVSDAIVDAKGRLVGVGWNGSVATFRLLSDGRVDRTFNGGQGVTTVIGSDQEGARAVALQSSGRVVVLGESLCCAKEFALVRLLGGTDHTRCLGHRATIAGTQGKDELTGTPRRDVIAALGGKDKVRALGGADLICGGKGHDVLFGGPGRDQVRQ